MPCHRGSHRQCNGRYGGRWARGKWSLTGGCLGSWRQCKGAGNWRRQHVVDWVWISLKLRFWMSWAEKTAMKRVRCFTSVKPLKSPELQPQLDQPFISNGNNHGFHSPGRSFWKPKEGQPPPVAPWDAGWSSLPPDVETVHGYAARNLSKVDG